MRNHPYVVSEDIGLLLGPWTREHHLTHPSEAFLRKLRGEMAEELRHIFPENDIVFVEENDLQQGITSLARAPRADRPETVSLDRVYFQGDPLLTLDTTRMIDPELRQLSKLGSRTAEPLDDQFRRILRTLKDCAVTTIQLVDDVVFSSGSITEIIRQFQAADIRVVRIVSGITIRQAKQDLQSAFPGIEVDSVREYEAVLDEICERDFYPGVPLSGRLIGEDGIPAAPEVGAPYLRPFGRPMDWASIPESQEKEWSLFCIRQSIKLWQEVERLSGRSVHCDDLSRRPRGIPWNDGSFIPQLEQSLGDI
jgi:hypothetical protein